MSELSFRKTFRTYWLSVSCSRYVYSFMLYGTFVRAVEKLIAVQQIQLGRRLCSTLTELAKATFMSCSWFFQQICNFCQNHFFRWHFVAVTHGKYHRKSLNTHIFTVFVVELRRISFQLWRFTADCGAYDKHFENSQRLRLVDAVKSKTSISQTYEAPWMCNVNET